MIWLIGLGGALGASARFMLGNQIMRLSKSLFPYSTFVINITGSFFLGLLINLHNSGTIGELVYSFLGIGFCGAFTTFSTFAYEAAAMMMKKQLTITLFYIICSVLISLAGAYIGLMV